MVLPSEKKSLFTLLIRISIAGYRKNPETEWSRPQDHELAGIVE
jgi:hypothetical protein